jgi:hypothetical protein
VTARWWAVSSLGLAPPGAGLFFLAAHYRGTAEVECSWLGSSSGGSREGRPDRYDYCGAVLALARARHNADVASAWSGQKSASARKSGGAQERTADNSVFSMDYLKVRADIVALERQRVVSGRPDPE